MQLSGLDFTLEKGSKWAVVGPNGCGKSTLLRILAGADTELDAGEVQLRKGTRLSFLPQEPQLRLDLPVLSAVFASDAPALRLVARYESALAAAAAGDSAASAQLQELAPQMDAAGAWSLEAEVHTVLNKLGCTPFLPRLVGDLSGGQRKRVALACALLSDPEILVLDEPTNHLSVEGVEWLEARLAGSSTTLLMVTHDRAFMNAVCTEILELDGSGGAFKHVGGYTHFLVSREERYHAQAAAAANAETLLRKEGAWMARQPQGRQAKAQARQDNFYVLQDAANATPQRMGTIDVEAGSVKASRLGDVIVELKDCSLSLGGTRILDRFSYTFARGERLGVVGPNGAGKTSFMSVCNGTLAVDSGSVVIGETVRFGHYEQIFDFPDTSLRVADYVAQLAAEARELDAKGKDWNGWSVQELMERFQFLKGRQSVPIAELSGGERRRLQLMTVLSTRPNFLSLDELTNDLDVDTIEAVEAMLEGFDGCVLLTGHDRSFFDALAQHILVFEGDARIRDWQGSYSELRAAQKADERAVPAAATASAPPAAPADKEARRVAQNAAKKIPKVEAALEKLDADIADLDRQLSEAASDAGKAAALAAARDKATAQLAELFAEYERLDALARQA